MNVVPARGWLQRFSCWLVARSGYFDREFYLQENEDVVLAGADPLGHYCSHGWREARRPCAGVHLGRIAVGPIGRHFGSFNPIVVWMLIGRWLGWTLDWPQMRNWVSAVAKPLSVDVAIVVHEATRTGAPIFALRLARWMRRTGRMNPVFVILSDGSLFPEIWEEFKCLPIFDLRRDERHDFLQDVLRNVPAVYLNSLATLNSWAWLEWHGGGTILHAHESVASIPDYLPGLASVVGVPFRVVTVNATTGARLAELTGIEPDIVPPAIELSKSSAMSGVLRRQLVVGCGTMSSRKGADLFCLVAAKVLERFEGELEFVWLGGAGDVNMQALLERLSIADRVHLEGEVFDPMPLLAEARVFLLPSRDDPFPLVALEAASCGTPVVCFDVMADGVGTWISNKAGEIVPAYDVEAMAHAVARLLLDDAWHHSTSVAALDASRQFDIEIVGSRIADIINDAVNDAMESRAGFS